MSKTYKRIMKNTKRLSNSERRFEDIYNIIFSDDSLIMTEQPTMTRKLLCTYGEAKQKIDIVARGIFSTLGSGKYIGLCAENCLEWLILLWAILKSGNKPYLVNLRQPTSFTEEIFNSLNVSAVIKHNTRSLSFNISEYEYSDLYKKGQDVFEITLPQFGNELAISTSGTTLNKKACIYTGYEISNQLLNVKEICKINRQIVKPYKGKLKHLMFLPLYHIFGLVAVYLWFAFFGASFVFLTDMSGENILRTVRNHKVTHIFAVPLLWHSLEKSLLHRINEKGEETREKFEKGLSLSYKLQKSFPCFGRAISRKLFEDVRRSLLGRSVQFCISGGSFIKESTLKLVNSLGYTLANGYGMSEIGICSVDLSKNISKRALGSIGKPFCSMKYRIDENGQLLTQGGSVCNHMIINGELTTMSEWFETGDIVKKSKDGRFFIEGRASDIVFSDDGENLNPDLAEKEFSIPYSSCFSVLGNENNSKLILVVQVPKNLMDYQISAISDSIKACNDALPSSYKVKGTYFTYDDIMQRGAIKVSRSYLKRELSEGRIMLFESLEKAVSSQSISEESDIKAYLKTIFSELLELDADKINSSSHFMLDLGGSSLDYFTLISEINEKFNITLNFEQGENFRYSIDDFEKIIKESVEKI